MADEHEQDPNDRESDVASPPGTDSTIPMGNDPADPRRRRSSRPIVDDEPVDADSGAATKPPQ